LKQLQARLGRRMYYGWVVAGVTFLALLVSAGLRSAPTVLIKPLEEDFGWSRGGISFAISIGLLLYGLSAPAVGSLMDRLGPRWLMLAALLLIGGSAALSAGMTTLWQFTLLWGLLGGIGTGLVALVLGATVANRWFSTRRGLVVGIFGSAASAGQLVFLPLLTWLIVAIGWRGSVLFLGACVLVPFVVTWLFMRDSPAELGLQPLGARETPQVAAAARLGPIMPLAVRVPEFWLLSGTFFICGATSNGLIGTHLLPHAVDIGISKVTAAGLLGVMGAMNFAGTITSGWLTDRYDPRKLLATYYLLRGCSLFLLPFVSGFEGLVIFAVVFGLDYIATVPPTVALTADIFGRRHVGTVYGWVFAAHQIGAASAAYLGGLARDAFGDYTAAFLAAGAMAVLGGLLALRIDREASVAGEPSVAAAAA
jgi:sugar phosphate permease